VTARPFEEIPPDRADGSCSWVHTALVVTGRLGTVRPWLLLPLWGALALLVTVTWPTLRLPAALITGGLIAMDWALLAALPLTRRSWGPVTPPLLGLALVHTGLMVVGGLTLPGATGLAITTGINLALVAIAAYATWIEPFRIVVTRQRLRVADWPEDAGITLLHLSDIHFEGQSRREEALLTLITTLQPDVILMTGDYLNLSSVTDPDAQAGARALLAELSAPQGVYAVTGSPVVDRETIVPEIFAGLPIRWLEDEAILLNGIDGAPIRLLGVRTTYDEARDTAALHALTEAPADASPTVLQLLLYHTPDLAPRAADAGIDLYLCGHTHGGQIRAPIYGAIATSSRFGKRYEQGRMQEGAMTLYISRGLGMEGLGAPRARFLAPPEVIVWELTGDGG
jgi:uncharacterized protein